MIHAACWLMGAVMTLTVSTKTTVTLSGEVPEGVTSTYRCTYQKGDIRASDTASLVMSGWGGEMLDSVVLYMRSNKSDGAGIISIVADQQEVCRKEGTYRDWTGSYSTTSMPIRLAIGEEVNQVLAIDIIGTKNSLHIEKYELHYSPAPQEAHTLTLHTPDGVEELSESVAGEGIRLPEVGDRNGWYAVGWSEEEVAQGVTCPKTYRMGQLLHPKEDMELWSLYSNQSNHNERKVYHLESGHYMLSYVIRNKSLCAPVASKAIETMDTEFGTDSNGVYIPGGNIPKACVYALTVDSLRGKCTLQHAQTHEYIGVSGSNLSATPTEWDYQRNADTTWSISYTENGYRHVLYLDYQTFTARVARQTAGMQTDNEILMWSLFKATDPNQPTYWTTQPTMLSDEAPRAEEKAVWVDMGIWKMRIFNGNKQIYLHR